MVLLMLTFFSPAYLLALTSTKHINSIDHKYAQKACLINRDECGANFFRVYDAVVRYLVCRHCHVLDHSNIIVDIMKFDRTEVGTLVKHRLLCRIILSKSDSSHSTAFRWAGTKPQNILIFKKVVVQNNIALNQ